MTTYVLRRERDGSGDMGPMCEALWIDPVTGRLQTEKDARPRVGVALKVGSYHARTMQWQDWWCTTAITEILEEGPSHVRFKTANSVYDWGKI